MQPQNPIPSNSMPSKPGQKSLIASIVLAVLLIVSLVFGYTSFTGKQDLQKNLDTKTAAAVAAAQKTQAAQLQAQYDAATKKPYKSFIGPQTYGSISISYPKTWSAYIDQTSTSEPINGYFYPNIVPGVSGNTAYALRIELVSSSYNSVVQQYSSQVQAGTLKAKVFTPAKLAKNKSLQHGTRFDGQLDGNFTGAMIAIPVRDQTLKIYTQSSDFVSDFNNIVLPSLTFSP